MYNSFNIHIFQKNNDHIHIGKYMQLISYYKINQSMNEICFKFIHFFYLLMAIILSDDIILIITSVF